jgi:polysaccharide export outer membrane protein
MSAAPRSWVALLLLVSIAGGGCARRVVHANRMPAHFRAADVSNAVTADLGRLSLPTTPNELIEPEDIIDVTIVSGIESPGQVAPTPVRLDDGGVAHLALVGPVRLAGLEPYAAEQVIAAAAIQRGLYRSPQVTVAIRKKAVNRITVIGAVEKQGVQELPRSQSTLLAALVAAGSLSKTAGTIIEVRRNEAASGVGQADSRRAGVVELTGLAAAPEPLELAGLAPDMGSDLGPELLRIDITALDAIGDRDIQLRDGDIVRVEPRDPVPVNVIGLVRKPGQFEMPVNKPIHVLDAIAMAGERSNPWADKILITRHVPGEPEPVVIQTSVTEAKHDEASNLRLAPGDIVSVEETPQTAMNYIITSIFRFGFAASLPIF